MDIHDWIVDSHYWIIDTHNRILDIYNIPAWFLDNHDWRMDIYNYLWKYIIRWLTLLPFHDRSTFFGFGCLNAMGPISQTILIHMSNVMKIWFCPNSFSGHQKKIYTCLNSIALVCSMQKIVAIGRSEFEWKLLVKRNAQQIFVYCPDGIIIREVCPWSECIFRSLLQIFV